MCVQLEYVRAILFMVCDAIAEPIVGHLVEIETRSVGPRNPAEWVEEAPRIYCEVAHIVVPTINE